MAAAFDAFVRDVVEAREGYQLPGPANRLAEEFTQTALALLFPHFAAINTASPELVRGELTRLGDQIDLFLMSQGRRPEDAGRVSHAVLGELPRLRQEMRRDAEATCEADPAATDVDEVLLAYPGFFALACYRLAHTLLEANVGLLPRLITEYAHRTTGIDIHPGARIGRSLAIDHGTGIVIGATAVLGDRVRLYQGVTLGALSVRKDLAQSKRHPTIEDDVVIYANATILGGDTVIGAGSVIGGNVWLTHSVAPGSVVTHGATIERPREAEAALLEYNI